jgi:putative Mg2+ transporter-C (MgtC) family protein
LNGLRINTITGLIQSDVRCWAELKEAAMWQEIWTTVVSEFSDIPDLSTMTRIVLRLVLAAILGGVIGYERERKASSAGVRTHMLVAVGAALFVLGPLQSGMEISDISRVLQGIVQGIGFLGAGAIIIRTSQHKVQGLTTAANIWVTAGIGVVVGLGLESTAVLSTIIVLIILAVVPYIVPATHQDDTNQKNS